MTDASQVQQFEEQGWLKLPGVLDPEAELARLRAAYEDLIDTLALAFHAEAGAELPPGFSGRPIGERFALMQGASGGHAVEHLDPVLSCFTPGHRRRSDLPSAQLPELFELLRAAPLLDAVESLVGAEIDGSPRHHVNFKLPASYQAIERESARALRRPDPTRRALHGFHIDRTPWHRDAPYGLPDAFDSRLVVAWVPMTPTGGERGTLTVLPGSHRAPRGSLPSADVLAERGIEVPAAPGDVVLFHDWTVHGSTPNESESDVRWAFSFRYLTRGNAGGRPYFPTVLLRSASEPERELHDGLLWQEIWRHALDHMARPTCPTPQGTSLEEARAITRAWRERCPDEQAWLRLAPSRSPLSRVRPFLRRVKHGVLDRSPWSPAAARRSR